MAMIDIMKPIEADCAPEVERFLPFRGGFASSIWGISGPGQALAMLFCEALGSGSVNKPYTQFESLDGTCFVMILHEMVVSWSWTVTSLKAHISVLPVSPEVREFLLFVADERSWTRTAQAQAESLGLKNRDALRAVLLSMKLPQWGTLKRWFRVYTLVSEAEKGRSFAKSALAEGHNPSSTYRTLEGLLKMKPGDILSRGGTARLLPELTRELDKIGRNFEFGRTADSA